MAFELTVSSKRAPLGPGDRADHPPSLYTTIDVSGTCDQADVRGLLSTVSTAFDEGAGTVLINALDVSAEDPECFPIFAEGLMAIRDSGSDVQMRVRDPAQHERLATLKIRETGSWRSRRRARAPENRFTSTVLRGRRPTDLRRFPSNGGTMMSVMRKSIAAGFLVFFCVAQNGSASEPVRTGGRVTDQRLGTPIAAAHLRIFDSSGTSLALDSDRQGRYHAIGLTPGIIEIVVESSGYEDERERCRVRDGESLRLDFTLVRSLTNLGPRRFSCVIEPETSDRYVIE